MRELADAWELDVAPPFPGITVSWTAPAVRADGTECALKVVFPEVECEHEGEALAFWAGRGAARLLERDVDRSALLVERLRPGEPLWSIPEREAVAVIASLLRTLHSSAAPPGPFRQLADEARRWAEEIPRAWAVAGRPYPRAVLDMAVGFLRDVPAPARPVVLHQDMHGGNVLRSGAGWRAIDPKPLMGDPAFDVASAIRDRRWELVRDPDPERTLAYRLDALCDALSLDRELARGWSIVHALAWGLDATSAHPDMLACACWLASKERGTD